ncbi:hypothetical protein QBC46DRAFT_95633 [Diplogelasinospora grovesii]|uniref:Uncharacterized protein n=1 Tax=Diplogelasinospora grovesii TaxID=303347 RepID=A0AAN6NIY2_9PEZI|nr:hypothetical protein QBC46DRAFT_95633 [Diplogelasinospora grovesii]
MSRATMSMPPPPPLLLTKRVTAFLHANLQNQSLPGSSQRLHTTALTTPGGKLLAHASTANLPARALRRQCAVAASLWALHAPNTPFSEAVHSSSSSTHSQSDHGHGGSRSGSSGGGAAAITVQLDSGMVFVIRRLECGMLFVAMGGAAPSDGSSRPGTA